ncbi:hypothetical protein DRO59_10055 [Candidatus Bathyarchaeota archaeon]|nr:MAG: hypothetical protein DRO59_10055 [Candidatus Bathyarchaeota archaeon]
MVMQEKLNEVYALVERLGKEYPNLAEPFTVFLRRVEEKGALDTKTKELISVALAVALHREWCIAFHTKKVIQVLNFHKVKIDKVL